ncbi:mitochondrial carrier [Piedraia hortae CBS 480.64]|uniref:Mitochondrial carrier n=1 Tax=Piedraia hortae CBS 480.64 TaxID=1314780 RepID=A0A6A7BRG0_9PEZI|nr:mitochondrial carrier [Piedraia hortae CBS 480.64]
MADGNQVYKDLFAGAIGGMAQVLIGQPFDIVKVRLQTSTLPTNAFDCARKILKNEGATAFYKGTLTPLIGIGACVSVQFGAYNYARRTFEKHNGVQPMQYWQYYASGAFAGIANTVFSSPIEHVRIRLQTQPHGPGRLYNGPLDCIRKLSQSPNIARGLYKGTSATLLREAAAYGAWFLSFEYMMQSDARRNDLARAQMPTWKVALYGGLAGEVLWIASYPFDVVKSKMQVDRYPDREYGTMRECFRSTWRADGVKGFWKGLGPTLLRAMPVSAGTFVTVELVTRALG